MNAKMIAVLGHDLELIDPNVKTCYLMNEGTGEVCKDSSQYGNNGTLKNGAKWAISEGESGIEFDGSDDYIEDVTGRHIVKEGTSGFWSKVIIGDKTKIVGTGTVFKFQSDANKKLTGQFISDFADYCTNLINFYCHINSFSGTLPSFAACTNLSHFYCRTNSFSGTLPSFAACTNLTYFYCHANSFSGTLPSFAACTNLSYFYCSTNSFSGTLPSFAACTNLINFYCYANSFSGTLPSFAACTNLSYFYCHTNSFSGYESGGLATQPNLAKVYLENNAISNAADINAILADLRTSYDLPGRVTCIVKLEGGTNAAPTGQGVTDRGFLNANGWTVTTN